MVEKTGKPLAEKLGLRPGQRACFLNAPQDVLAVLDGPLRSVEPADLSGGRLDLVQVFEISRDVLERQFPVLKAALHPAGMLWVCWPKRTSKIKTDLDENRIREIGLRSGLVDVKVCAVDDTWSGMKFVFRTRDR